MLSGAKQAEQIDTLRSQVDFLQNSEILIDTRGHSRVPCFVIKKPRQKYFAKLYPGQRVEDLQKIEQTYQDLRIPTAQIVATKYLSNLDATFCAYEYIEGETFAELLPKLSSPEIEQLGKKVGREIKKFHAYKGDWATTQKFQETFDLELKQLLEIAKTQQRKYDQQNPEQKLPEIGLERFEKSLQRLKQQIYKIPINFTHTDINLTNIIIDHDQPVLVDTDGSKMAFRALDFRGNVWWCWNPDLSSEEVEKEQAAYRGIYRGMFDENIPASFHQELSFTMLYEFLVRVQKYADNAEQVYYSFMRWHENLRQTNYFENYQFPWL